MNQVAGQERFLHVAAEKATRVMLTRARSDPKAKKYILEGLLSSSFGGINYDAVTKTKTIDSLLSQMSGLALKEVLPVYEQLIIQPDTQDVKEAASQRQVAADQLLSALRNMQMDQSESEGSLMAAKSLILLLARCAYFDLDGLPEEHSSKPSPLMSQASREVFRLRIASCLAHLLSKLEHPARPIYDVVSTINEWGETLDVGKPLLDVDVAVREVIQLAWDVLAKVNFEASATPSESSAAKSFSSIQLLYSLTMLQIYNEDADAVNMLDELNGYFKPLISKKSFKNGSAALIEVLLSFASKPSQLFRRLTQQVFTAFASEIDELGLQSMISVRSLLIHGDTLTDRDRSLERKKV